VEAGSVLSRLPGGLPHAVADALWAAPEKLKSMAVNFEVGVRSDRTHDIRAQADVDRNHPVARRARHMVVMVARTRPIASTSVRGRDAIQHVFADE
jgi:hypothetical protein